MRLADMMFGFLRHKGMASLIILDTYSTTAFWYVWILAQLCKLYDKPYVPILHGGELEKRLKSTPRFSRSVFRHAHQIVSPSLFLQAVFQQYGYTNVIFVPNSIELEKYKFVNRSSFLPRLLWVRSFHQIYRPQMAIQVLKELQCRYPLASLLMVGQDKDGSMKVCKQMAKEFDLTDHVQFTGFLPKSEWIARSREFDIFINTTSADNMPVSVIEAMALGFPIVSTRVGGIPYLIEDGQTGFLVNENDIGAMVDRISFICDHPKEARKVAYQARKKVEEYDWRIVKHQWNQLLSS